LPENGIPPPSSAFVWLLKYPYFSTANRLHFTIIKKKTPRAVCIHMDFHHSKTGTPEVWVVDGG